MQFKVIPRISNRACEDISTEQFGDDSFAILYRDIHDWGFGLVWIYRFRVWRKVRFCFVWVVGLWFCSALLLCINIIHSYCGEHISSNIWHWRGASGIMLKVNVFTVLLWQHKSEKDGVIETRIEKRLVVSGDLSDFDHDKVSWFGRTLHHLLFILQPIMWLICDYIASKLCINFLLRWRVNKRLQYAKYLFHIVVLLWTTSGLLEMINW